MIAVKSNAPWDDFPVPPGYFWALTLASNIKVGDIVKYKGVVDGVWNEGVIVVILVKDDTREHIFNASYMVKVLKKEDD